YCFQMRKVDFKKIYEYASSVVLHHKCHISPSVNHRISSEASGTRAKMYSLELSPKPNEARYALLLFCGFKERKTLSCQLLGGISQAVTLQLCTGHNGNKNTFNSNKKKSISCMWLLGSGHRYHPVPNNGNLQCYNNKRETSFKIKCLYMTNHREAQKIKAYAQINLHPGSGMPSSPSGAIISCAKYLTQNSAKLSALESLLPCGTFTATAAVVLMLQELTSSQG
ncbi:hypothetical protein STEG23_021204, partial [Scotinomys teguina]